LHKLTCIETKSIFNFDFIRINNNVQYELKYVPHQKKFFIPINTGLVESDVQVFRQDNGNDINLHIITVPFGAICSKSRRLSYLNDTSISMSTGWVTDILEEKFNISSKDLINISESSKITPISNSEFSLTFKIKDILLYRTFSSSQPRRIKSNNLGLCLSLNELYNSITLYAKHLNVTL